MRSMVGAVVAVGALVLAGCGSSADTQASPTGPSAPDDGIAADVPTGIDPCAIPQDVLTSITPGLHKGVTDDNTSRGKIKWRGCRYLVSEGYSTTVSLTNLTLSMVREKHFPGEREDIVNGRVALTTHQASDPTGVEGCVVNLEMRGGSLEFTVDNGHGSSPKTKHLNACGIGLTVAQKVAPLIAAGS